MKDFISRLQKDLKGLQKTIEKEGNQLVGKVRKAAKDIANNKNVAARRRDIEKMIEKQYKSVEPTVQKLLKDLKKNAAKYGIDVNSIEKTVRSSYRAATNRLGMKKTGVAKRKTSAKKKKASPRKTSTASA